MHLSSGLICRISSYGFEEHGEISSLSNEYVNEIKSCFLDGRKDEHIGVVFAAISRSFVRQDRFAF